MFLFMSARPDDRAELRELADVLRRIHRLERILVLELRDHERQEVFLVELGLLGVGRVGRAPRRRPLPGRCSAAPWRR